MQVILFHLNQVGDFCFSLPVAAAVKQRYPQAQICSVVRPPLVPLAERARPIDSVEARPRSLTKGYWGLIRRLRARRADMTIVLPTSRVPCLLSWLCRAKRVVGFDKGWARRFIREKVSYDGHPSLANNLRLAEYVGGNVFKRDYLGLLAATEQDRVSTARLLAAHEVSADEPIAVLAPFASPTRLWKCWPHDRFVQVATLLYERAGLTSVFVGTLTEAEAIGQLVTSASVPAVSLAGQTTTGELLGLLDRAAVFIGIDSGIAHLAAALQRPTVAIFGPTDPALTGPVGEMSAIIYKRLACSPCHNRAAGCSHRKCLLSIEPDEVVTAALRLTVRSGALREVEF